MKRIKLGPKWGRDRDLYKEIAEFRLKDLEPQAGQYSILC